MESPHPDERPAKKRRFFTENSSPAQIRSKHYNPPPQSSPQAPSSPVHVSDEIKGGDDAAALDGFDVGMLQAVVGELPCSTLQKLKDVSSGNVERGRHCYRVDLIPKLNAGQRSTYTSMAHGPLLLFLRRLPSSNHAPSLFKQP